MSSSAFLRVEEVTKAFPIKKGFIRAREIGSVKAVNHVSFTLAKGETLGVIGESGCGKSTLARLVLGITAATSGDIAFKGQPVSPKMPRAMRQHIQMIYQDPYSSIDPRMNVRRIIEEPLRVHTHLSRQEKRDVILPILAKVGLPQDALEKYPHEFSGGQRQRIGIARALALQPELVLCDEPVSALDVSIQAQILNLFKKLQQDFELTYLFISHDMSVIRHVSTSIAVMYLGNLIELAPKRELFSHTLHPYTQALMSAIPVPDPAHPKKRVLLRGELPSPINVPPGCPFQTRCPWARDTCRQQAPRLREAAPGHWVACDLVNERA